MIFKLYSISASAFLLEMGKEYGISLYFRQTPKYKIIYNMRKLEEHPKETENKKNYWYGSLRSTPLVEASEFHVKSDGKNYNSLKVLVKVGRGTDDATRLLCWRRQTYAALSQEMIIRVLSQPQI